MQDRASIWYWGSAWVLRRRNCRVDLNVTAASILNVSTSEQPQRNWTCTSHRQTFANALQCESILQLCIDPSYQNYWPTSSRLLCLAFLVSLAGGAGSEDCSKLWVSVLWSERRNRNVAPLLCLRIWQKQDATASVLLGKSNPIKAKMKPSC